MAKAKTSEKRQGIESVVDEIKQKFGEGMIMKLGEIKKVDVEVVPTGSISLDIALGIGGMPRGSSRSMVQNPPARRLSRSM